MKKINEMVEGLLVEASNQLAQDLKANPQKYKDLIRSLLLQGLIKLIEPSITLKVRKSDVAIIKEQVDNAVKEYKRLMLSQVRDLKDRKDIPCKVSIDEANFLPEWNPDEP